MAVFTAVTPAQLSDWLKNYSIGTLRSLQGILRGIENTNYFVSTSDGEFVLTLFEVLRPEEIRFYLNFMAHLANHGIPCPKPIANLENEYLGELAGKPASIVSRLKGQSVTVPTSTHCAKVGAMLANMHLAAKTFPPSMDNPRGALWWRSGCAQVRPFLSAEEWRLLESELAYQLESRAADLPRGVVHADLFRDNVLFEDHDIGGVIDFYFAGADSWMFDLAVAVNDWCIASPSEFDAERVEALVEAYHQVRPVTEPEMKAWSTMLRAGALRFWLSRLVDFHLPRRGELIIPHDPHHFRRILELHRRSEPRWPGR